MSTWKIIKAYLILLLLFLNIKTTGQTDEFLLRNIGINEGLSQNSVVAVAIDSSGYVWFATQDGLNRYDGRNFEKLPFVFDDITTSSDKVLGSLAASANRLWMITTGGKIEVLDIYTHEHLPFKFPGNDNFKPIEAICLMPDEKNNLWVGAASGLYYCDFINDTLIHINKKEGLNNNRIYNLYNDDNNKLIALSGKGVYEVDKNTYSYKLFEAGGQANEKWSVLKKDINGTYWAGTFGNGVFISENGSGEFRKFTGTGNYTIPENLVVYTIVIDKKGRIWAGTYGNGLYIIDTKTNIIYHLIHDKKSPFSLGFNDVLALEEDKSGGVWIGTDGGGAGYYNDKLNIFRQFSEKNVPDNISIDQIRSITDDSDDVVWLGTSGKGLTSIDAKNNRLQTFHLKPFKEGISNYDRIVSLHNNDKNTIWAGTQGNGLLLLNKSTGSVNKWFHTEAAQKIPDNTIWSIVPENEKQIWIGTRYAGLCLLDKEKGVQEHYINDGIKTLGIAENSAQVIIKDDNDNLFLGFTSKGIQHFNKTTKRFSQVAAKQIEKLFNNQTAVKSLYYKNPFLLVGTSGKGLLVVNTQTDSVYQIDETKGLPNNTVYGILSESDNDYWISTNKGLCRIHFGDGFQKPQNAKFNYYTAEDGLQSNEFNTGAYYKSESGEFFFGGIKGFNRFKPLKEKYGEADIPVKITSVLIDNLPLLLDTVITYKKHIDLKYQQNSIAFNFSAMDFILPEKLNYQYQLVNYDHYWVDADERTYVAYTNLPPGSYIFRVRVAGSTIRGSADNGLSIYIRSPLWMRWWFIGLVALLFTGILYGLYQYRINQILRVQRMRNEISADLHDDIGSRLTNIQLLSAISKQKLSDISGADVHFDSIQEQVQSSAEALDEIVWNMKIKDDDLDNIMARMRRYAGEVFETDGISYTVNISEDFEGKEMSMEKRRDIFLVFREVLNNIRKHAAAKHVDIRIFSKEKNSVLLYITDDGKGFDTDKSTTRNGLKNIKDRITRWGGKVSILSYPDKGTSVEIAMPFEKESLIKRIFWRRAKH